MLKSQLSLPVLALALLVGGCQADQIGGTHQPVDPTTGVVADTSPAPAQGQGQGQDPAQQRARFLVERYLEDARRLRVEGKLEEAKLAALKALDYAPQDERAREILAAIQSELGEGAGEVTSYADQMQRLAMIREERARADVRGRLDEAARLSESGEFSRAVQELRAAMLNIEVGTAIDWGSLEGEVRGALATAEARRDEMMRQERAQAEEQIVRRLRAEEEQRRARRDRQVGELVRTAMTAFERRRFKLSQDLAFDAMRLDPTSDVARGLHDAATKALRESRDDTYYLAKVREIARMKESLEELKIPQTDILRMDNEAWAKAEARAARTVTEVTENQADAALRAKVRDTMVEKLSFNEETGAFNDVIKTLNRITELPIIITPAAKAVIDSESVIVAIDLASPMSLANFLTFAVQRSENLAWSVRDGIVRITSKEDAGGATVTKPYDIRDLTFTVTDFIPPVIRDIPVGESTGPRTGGEAEENLSYIEPEELKGFVEKATGPSYWAEGGGRLEVMESGYLLVTATPEMHQKVRKFLEDQRRFATSIVSIESKFLTISRNYLQEIGVDFRGLGGDGKGTVAQLDDVTNSLDDNASRGLDNSGTGDEAGHPASGAFFDDGGDGDARGTTENFFNSRLARTLTNTGGLTAAWTYLNDLQFQAILRAVEKRQDVQLVNAQQLSVFNTQRAHVAIVNQTSYIKDYEVEVAQASFIADPKVDVIQDGLVLDVRPVIAHDRRHILLNLQPTVAELQLPIPTFSTSLAGSTLPVILQLPTMTVRQFATTVTVPDGGSVLIGGLREVLTTERRATVPFFGKLPLISFLFKQEGVADENTSLMVLIRAVITDVRDLVAERRR